VSIGITIPLRRGIAIPEEIDNILNFNFSKLNLKKIKKKKNKNKKKTPNP